MVDCNPATTLTYGLGLFTGGLKKVAHGLYLVPFYPWDWKGSERRERDIATELINVLGRNDFSLVHPCTDKK